MIENHPITPPPELVKQWVSLACEYEGNETWIDLATQAANWGADQELEACCEWLYRHGYANAHALLPAARRPKPPSLKEQALDTLNLMLMFLPPGDQREQGETIRRALEALPD